jgi:hypothetical protein
MVLRLFATKLETAETMEDVALNILAPYSLTDLNSKGTLPVVGTGNPPAVF